MPRSQHTDLPDGIVGERFGGEMRESRGPRRLSPRNLRHRRPDHRTAADGSPPADQGDGGDVPQPTAAAAGGDGDVPVGRNDSARPARPRCPSGASSNSWSSRTSSGLRTRPREVAERLQRLYQDKGCDHFFIDDKASFTDPLVRVRENTAVILLMYQAMGLFMRRVKYDIRSAFGGRQGRVLVEAEVTYEWRLPVSLFLRRALTFHLFHTAHIQEREDERGEVQWRCSSLEEVWDFNALSLFAYVLTSPLVWLAAILCRLCAAIAAVARSCGCKARRKKGAGYTE